MLALLFSSASIVTAGIWFSTQLFFNPDAVIWLNQLLPKWAQFKLINQEQPQTLTQIQQQLSRQGLIAGEPVSLDSHSNWQMKTIVLPVRSFLSQCQCQQIVELRVYQLAKSSSFGSPNSQPNYQLVNRVPIQGPAESFVLAPLLTADSGYSGSNQPLPLSELHRFDETQLEPGVWLYLIGYSQERGTAIAYGYILHYNPSHTHLSLLLPWASPIEKIPQWQKLSSNSAALIIDQTIDLEPRLQAYQVKPAEFFLDPIQLEPISLTEPAVNDPAYKNALLIAQSGLWTPAWKQLQHIKQHLQPHHLWTADAQAQMELIQLCAQRTAAQAEQVWVTPSQQVLAQLIDGRWRDALQVFQASPENTQEITTLLKTDTGRIWNRVEVALKVNPQSPEVKAWGALIVAAQQGQKAARAWLEHQPHTTPATIAYIQPLLKRLEGQFSTTSTSSHSHQKPH